jgi:lactoylglutathione lyase
MNAPLLGLRTVVYMVPDLATAKEWYNNVLGITPYFDEVFYVGYNVGGYELGLHPAEEAATKGNHGGTAYWGVENVQEVYDRLLAAGATTAEEPTEVGGGIVIASVYDPWNNPFGIIYNPHFSLPQA